LKEIQQSVLKEIEGFVLIKHEDAIQWIIHVREDEEKTGA
jgi:hypothetical protein